MNENELEARIAALEQRVAPGKSDPPLRVRITYAPPSPSGDAAWFRSLQVLRSAAEKETEDDR